MRGSMGWREMLGGGLVLASLLEGCHDPHADSGHGHEGSDPIVLLVEDDGRGMPTGANVVSASVGLGMTSMRARARVLGGELEVVDLKARGLRIRVEVPRAELPPAQEQKVYAE